jgi:hypothetical protein
MGMHQMKRLCYEVGDYDGLINRTLVAAIDIRANLVCCLVSGTPFVVSVKRACELEVVIFGGPCETICRPEMLDQTFVLK